MRLAGIALPTLAVGAGLVACLLVVLANGWVAEDAYLTFRVLDNFSFGYGLRWNIDERVQVYTHPLWMLLQLPFFMLFANPFLLSIFLGTVCMMLAVVAAIRVAPGKPWLQLVFFILPIMLSRTLMEYATSGLESSLTFLLIALLFHAADFEKKLDEKRTRTLFFLGGLAMFTRLDMGLIVGPVLAYTLLSNLSGRHLKSAAIGLLPLLGWLLFSFIYYGFFLPNTAYAKLGNGLPATMQFENGEAYFKLLLTYDFPASFWLYAGLPIITAWALKHLQIRFYHRIFLFALGAVFYMVFSYAAGGDYMAGRFFATPLFITHMLALAVIAREAINPLRIVLIAGVLIGVYGWYAQDRASCRVCYQIDPGTMIDARSIFDKNQLVKSFWPIAIRTRGEHGFAREGKALRHMPPPRIKVQNFAGMAGYYAGPDVILVDQHGLSDPLLARLPASRNDRFYAGHFYRELPQGYLYALHTGSTQQMDVMLASYYQALKVITHEPVFNFDRLYTLLAFYLGDFDAMRDDYVRRHP